MSKKWRGTWPALKNMTNYFSSLKEKNLVANPEFCLKLLLIFKGKRSIKKLKLRWRKVRLSRSKVYLIIRHLNLWYLYSEVPQQNHDLKSFFIIQPWFISFHIYIPSNSKCYFYNSTGLTVLYYKTSIWYIFDVEMT